MNQNPPDISDFNQQVANLVSQFGATAFCALPGQSPEHALFMDADQVIAISGEDPRFPYGFFCEINNGLTNAQVTERLQHWLESGEAYEEFVGMNVCRYNC